MEGPVTRRYAALAALAGLSALLACAACGTGSSSTVTAPTTPVTSTVAVTAPTVPQGTGGVPMFSGSPAATSTGAPVQVTPVPHQSTGASAASAPRATASVSASSSTTATPKVASPPAAASDALRIVSTPIPFSDARKQEMSAYSLRHYGSAGWQLTPSMVVLHFTAGGTAASTRNAFAVDTPNAGELPGTCAHFVIDKDGTVYALVPTSVRCRHTIGLNDQAIGIEMVQEAGSSSSWADQQILGRPAQIGAALALVRSLQAQYGITSSNVVGHATANLTPQFHDLTGARNDHTDWQAADVARFRSLL